MIAARYFPHLPAAVFKLLPMRTERRRGRHRDASALDFILGSDVRHSWAPNGPDALRFWPIPNALVEGDILLLVLESAERCAARLQHLWVEIAGRRPPAEEKGGDASRSARELQAYDATPGVPPPC